jgi:hypothetical protein
MNARFFSGLLLLLALLFIGFVVNLCLFALPLWEWKNQNFEAPEYQVLKASSAPGFLWWCLASFLVAWSEKYPFWHKMRIFFTSMAIPTLGLVLLFFLGSLNFLTMSITMLISVILFFQYWKGGTLKD